MRSLMLAVAAALAGSAVTLWMVGLPPTGPEPGPVSMTSERTSAPPGTISSRSQQPEAAGPQSVEPNMLPPAQATAAPPVASGSATASSPTARASASPVPADPAVRAAFRGQLEVADRNGDGLISRDEAAAALPDTFALFESMDEDRDGQLNEAEMQSFRAEASTRMRDDLERRFADADLDGDGALDLAEAQTGLAIVAANFMLLDADNDGRVSLEELRTRGRRKN